MIRLIDPTGSGVREYDAMGGGWFKAPRGNAKLHNGLDFVCEPGQEIVCPVIPEGVLVREALPYQDNSGYSGLVIDAGELLITLFYVKPHEELLGVRVIGRQPIGIAQDISQRYGQHMTPHVHMRILLNHSSYLWQGGSVYINPKLLF